MYNVFCFDFDGTITTKDTLLEFIAHAKGRGNLLLGFLRYSPFLVLMKLHLYPNYKIKEKIFSHFFKGTEEGVFNGFCTDFAKCRKGDIIRPDAIKEIEKAVTEGAKVFIVSASIDNWVAPFFKEMVEKKEISVLGTKIEIKDGLVTGHFLSKNCYGKEKVNRITEVLGMPREECFITAFGDSRGDKEMLDYADKGFYKPFRR